MKKPVLILVPRLDDSGPMKGAVALANGLAADYRVLLATLKGTTHQPNLDGGIHLVSLESGRAWWGKRNRLRQILAKFSGEDLVASISFCFSADVLNRMLTGKVRHISSVRGNLGKNYYHTYGPMGHLLAFFHYTLLRLFDDVVVLSADMQRRLNRWGLRTHLIGNFIDEPRLARYRFDQPAPPSDRPRLLFLGGLNSRKRPDLLIRSAHLLKQAGRRFHLTIAGDGPMAKTLQQMSEDLNLGDDLTLMGHVSSPYSLLQQCDLLVHPSDSEGISRAILEAMYFGLPCVLRNVDGNGELVRGNAHGFLFSRDEELVPTLNRALDSLTAGRKRGNLIPGDFRFETNIQKFKVLLNG